MWPIKAAELVRVCGGSCAGVQLDALLIHAATVGDMTPAAGQIFVPVQEDVDGHDYVARALSAGVSLALVNRAWRGISALPRELSERCVLVDDALGAYRALAHHMRRRFTFPVIAVAGSNGKTTTKEIIASLLAESGLRVSKTPHTMNGFSGIPYTLCQPEHRAADPPDVLVVEIGIDVVGAMADHAAIVEPDVAVITALGAEHLDGLRNVETAAREERVLFQHAQRCVLVDDDVVHVGERELGYRVQRTTPHLTETRLVWRDIEGDLLLPLGGAHNARNLAGAVGAVLASELVPAEELLGRRRVAVTAPSMRCEIKQLSCGITLVDDCYNASPASVRAALAVIDCDGWRRRPKVVVLGDMLDLGDATVALHADLVEPLARLDADLLLVGSATRVVADAIPRAIWFAADTPAETIASHVPDAHDAVVLVKGSRGNELERVVAALANRPAVLPSPLHVAVVGRRRVEVAARIAEALGRVDTADVRALDVVALAESPRPQFAAVFTGFEVSDRAKPPDGVSPEEFHLALMAQPFLNLPAGGLAILDRADELAEMLAEAVPDGVRTVKCTIDDAVELVKQDYLDRSTSSSPK